MSATSAPAQTEAPGREPGPTSLGGQSRGGAGVEARRAGVDRRAMTVLSLGHMFTDIAQGSIPALLPFLIADRHIGIAAASALVLAATISSSVVQPAFGYVSDRVSLPWLMPLGPALGGLGVALVGFVPELRTDLCRGAAQRVRAWPRSIPRARASPTTSRARGGRAA